MLNILRAFLGALLTLAGIISGVYFGLWVDDIGRALAWGVLLCLLGGIIAPDPVSLHLMRSDDD